MSDQRAKTSQEADNELLTAYLDGELPDSECIAVEKRLGEDPSFHNLMRELQTTWDMLDSLPLVKPNSQFVNTTVEMAVAGQFKRRSFANGLLKGLLLLLIPATAFGLSYFFKRESIEQPERELVNDLPLIENRDRYTKAIVEDSAEGGIAFLRSLYDDGLLGEPGDLFAVDSKVSNEAPDDIEETVQPPNPQRIKDRSDRLSRMTDQQLAELFKKKEKFDALPQKQRETLRKFHDLLTSEPDRNKLAGVLSSYYDLLKDLGPSQRARLLDLPLDQRLKEIGRIARQRAEDAFGTIGSSKLPEKDTTPFYRWYEISIRYYHLEIREQTGEVLLALQLVKGMPFSNGVIDRIKTGPIEQLVAFLMRNDREYLGRLLCRNSPTGDIGIPLLRHLVSAEANEILDQPGFTRQDREELILVWIENANQSRFLINPDALKKFYRQLSQENRDQLDNQHPDDWHEALTRMYWKAKIGERSSQSDEDDFVEFLRQNGLYAEFQFWEDDEQ